MKIKFETKNKKHTGLHNGSCLFSKEAKNLPAA
jgi:hypothetical protein